MQSNNILSFTNTLILFALGITFFAFYNRSFYDFGINKDFFEYGIYHIWLIQFFMSQFLHGTIFHLLFNILFIGYFGNIVEQIIGYKKMLFFFISTAIFLGVSITLLSSGNTIGMSGFAMAILSYYTLFLWKKGDLEYRGGITAIIINVVIGLNPGISFLGHLGGAIFGALFFFFEKGIFKKKKT